MVRDPYHLVAKSYDSIFGGMNKGLRLLGVRMCRPKSGMSILDVGCGTGLQLEGYKRLGCELHGIDSSPAMLGVARKRLGSEADLRLADASEMPYEDKQFDLIISMLALHEMGPDTRFTVMREMKRVLKDSGRMLLIDYHRGPIRGLEGWTNRLVIFLAEVAAGRRHYRNYRHFMSVKGLQPLIVGQTLAIDRHRTHGGGALALYLLSKEGSAGAPERKVE